MSQVTVPQPEVEAAIAAVAARCLRYPEAFDPDIPFALLGMDSLGTIEMAAALEETLRCELPPDLLLDCHDARALAVRITELRDAGAILEREDPFEQILADAVLPEDVRPPRGVRRSTDLRAAKRILLTGATGFLGGALLDELVRTTSAEIVCLVRDGCGADADTRLASAFGRKTHLLRGDLSQPRLGLTDEQFVALAADVDAIVHCGAAVNWVYPYSALRAPNVLGTLELLRLACIRGVPFHFVSSLSVCYSSEGPQVVDEGFDPLAHIRGVQLGYAQSKCAAEALVLEAERRGLPARIYRPALISGDGRTGAYNRDDLVSALVRGCVRMGTAPDLDWKLDCVPVDFIATAIVSLSGERGPVFHLGHERPRHWRECVLWMRMYGYPLRLVAYHAWLRQLDRETGPAAPDPCSHPLRPLRALFLDRHRDSSLTLPELYEEHRRTIARSTATSSLLAARGLCTPPLNAELLDTYFRAFRDEGDLPDPPVFRTVHAASRDGLRLDRAFLVELLRRPVRDARVIGCGSDHSIVSELTAWRSRRPSGLFRVNVASEDGSCLDIRLKLKAADSDVVSVGESLAALVDPALGKAYARWGDRLGFVMSHQREIAIYRQVDPRFVRHAPGLLGSMADDGAGTWAVALENLEGAMLLDTAGDPSGWTPPHIQTAIDGLAALQAIWFGRETELRAQPWIGYVQCAAGMEEMVDLWMSLARHACPAFSSWAQPDIGTIQQRLIATIPKWWPALQSGPRTLIHNDFNPRNICLRPAASTTTPAGAERLTAYDWELATIGAPQRDLAEFLCFVVPHDVAAADVERWIDYHRQALERETGEQIDHEVWREGFRAGLYDLLLNRLAIYAVVDRIRRQSFLPRTVGTWRRLYEQFPLEDGQ